LGTSAKSKFCVSIIRSSTAEAIEDIAAASQFTDFIELRIDWIRNLNLKALLQAAKRCGCRTIVTNRAPACGGKFHGGESQRIELLETAAKMGADFIDIEDCSISRLKYRGKSKLIVSHHNFTSTPANLQSLLRRLCGMPADVLKVVTKARDFPDNLRTLQLLRDSPKPVVSFCMGEAGICSRVLALSFGAPFIYVSLRKGLEAAEGQITFDQMSKIYRADKINKKTQIYGLIGSPVSHSIGATFHNEAFRLLGLDAVYIPFEVRNLKDSLSALKRLNLCGLSVTTPFKEKIFPLLSGIDPVAASIGAVNTITLHNKELIGYNTDGEGAVCALLEVVGSLSGKKCLILGAGGAASAIAYSLKNSGAIVVISNRTPQRGKRIASRLGVEFVPWQRREQVSADILVNATTVGFGRAGESLVSEKLFRPGMVALDVVYFPAQTEFLRFARSAGAAAVSGLRMYYYQALRQLELWTGKSGAITEKFACYAKSVTFSTGGK
jgi:3-dehydroquinate dehydratase/shikimate dehydrogenase